MLPYNFFERVIYEIDLKNTFPDDFSPPIVLYEPELSGSFYFTMLHPSNQSLTNEQKSMAGYYDVNFHNTYTKKSNRTFIEIATKNDVNLTANTWIKLGLPVPLPKYSVNHKAPCTIINGSTTYAGMVMVSTDGQIKVWSPLIKK